MWSRRPPGASGTRPVPSCGPPSRDWRYLLLRPDRPAMPVDSAPSPHRLPYQHRLRKHALGRSLVIRGASFTPDGHGQRNLPSRSIRAAGSAPGSLSMVASSSGDFSTVASSSGDFSTGRSPNFRRRHTAILIADSLEICPAGSRRWSAYNRHMKATGGRFSPADAGG